jgi:hypothetical protein
MGFGLYPPGPGRSLPLNDMEDPVLMPIENDRLSNFFGLYVPGPGEIEVFFFSFGFSPAMKYFGPSIALDGTT